MDMVFTVLIQKNREHEPYLVTSAAGTESVSCFRMTLALKPDRLHPAGLGGSAILCAAFPFYPADERVILAAVALLGVCAGVAFGSSYQLVSRFGARESVALTTGSSIPTELSLQKVAVEVCQLIRSINQASIVTVLESLHLELPISGLRGSSVAFPSERRREPHVLCRWPLPSPSPP